MARNSGGAGVLSYHVSAAFPERQIAERVWATAGATGSPDFAVVIMHGVGLHSGWYGEIGDAICAIGGTNGRVSCAEFPGFGLSYDPVQGCRGYVPDCNQLVQESVACIQRARAAIGMGKKMFLMGESLGSLIVMSALVDGALEDIDGVILSGACLGLGPTLSPPAFAVAALRVLAYFRPTYVLPVNSGGEAFNRAFGDPYCAKLAREDPLTLNCAPFRVQNLITILDTMKKVQNNAPDKVRLKSLLYMHYIDDGHTSYIAAKNVIDNLKFVGEVQAFTVEGRSHQLFQDTPEITRRHIKVVTDFISEQLAV